MENPASCDQMQNQIYSQSVPDGWVEYKYRIKFNPNPPNPNLENSKPRSSEVNGSSIFSEERARDGGPSFVGIPGDSGWPVLLNSSGGGELNL